LPTDAEADEAGTGLLRLAAAGLVVGAGAGLVGSAFHAVLDRADALRDRDAARRGGGSRP
jgi:hypothetical protein